MLRHDDVTLLDHEEQPSYKEAWDPTACDDGEEATLVLEFPES